MSLLWWRITHALRVTYGVARNHTLRPTVLLAALLHDSMEDGWCTNLMWAILPMSVLELIWYMTRRPDRTYEEYIWDVRVGGDDAIAIKKSDLFDNLAHGRNRRSLGPRYIKALRTLGVVVGSGS